MSVHETETVGLLPGDTLEDFRRKWDRVQVAFVDEPRTSVEQADRLVNDVVTCLSDSFTRERNNLESTWQKGGAVSTEDLRTALQRYRSFFHRLLTV